MLRRIFVGFLVLVGLAGIGAIWVFSRYSSWQDEQAKRLESGSKLANTAKGPLEYALAGSAERTILFVHGTPGGYDQGVGFAEAGKSQGYRVLRVSRPGYLRTPLSTGSSPAEQADAYAALLDTLGIRKVSVVGVSGGGPSSAEFAARHPDRCEALFMISAISMPRASKQQTEPNRREQFMRSDFGGFVGWRSAHRDPQATIDRLIRSPENRRRLASPERRNALLALVDSALILPSRRGLGADNDRRWFTEMPEIALSSIRAPTLAIHGDQDTTVDIANAEALVKQVPGAQLVRIAGGDHLISLTHPTEVFGPIFDLLTRIGAPAPVAQAEAAPTVAQ